MNAYEFKIREPGFWSWVEEKGWPRSEFSPFQDSKKQVQVLRFYAGDKGVLPNELWTNTSQGYVLSRQTSNGGGMWVLYGSEKQRAYFRSSPR